jgi:hypothetical protein
MHLLRRIVILFIRLYRFRNGRLLRRQFLLLIETLILISASGRFEVIENILLLRIKFFIINLVSSIIYASFVAI